jgi:hypothetical protein
MSKHQPQESSFKDVIDSHREARPSSTQVPEILATPSPKNRVGRSSDDNYVKLTAYVPRHMHLAAKMELLQQGREMSDLITELVTEWLKRTSPPKLSL